MRILFVSLMLIGALTTKGQDTDSKKEKDVIFTKVEQEARVDQSEWRNHLLENLVPVIDSAVQRGIRPGRYTVLVRFIVEKNGTISDVHATNDPGYGLAEGAVMVVRSGPKWKPGQQNKRKVRSYHTQPINFVITEE